MSTASKRALHDLTAAEAAGLIHCIFEDLLGFRGELDLLGIEVGHTA